MTDTAEERGTAQPSAEHPERGRIYLLPGVALADVLHWVEDGTHHFRSLEFDVMSVDEDEQEAVDQFVEWTEDLLELIAGLDPNEITDSEQTLYNRLAERFREAYARLEERQRKQRWIEIYIGRRRRATRGNWRPASPDSEPETHVPASTV